MVYYDDSGVATEVDFSTASAGDVLTLTGGIIIGDDPAYPEVTGLGTATLNIVWDNVTYDRLFDYTLGAGTYGLGAFSPELSQPANWSAASATGYTLVAPMVIIETLALCGGLGYDEATCTATGARVGDPAGYYVSGGVWRSASGGGETGGPLTPEFVTP